MKTQTNRALDYLEAIGWTAGIVERKVTRTVSKDLFGFIDVVAINPQDVMPTLGLQITDHTSVAKRLKKTLAEPRLMVCLRAGWRIEVWGIRDKATKEGKYLKARALVLEDDQVRVVDDSLVLDV